MTDNASPFYEGAKVAIVNRHWGFNVLRWATVSRVYKTGRFILDGNKQQYRPDPDGKTAWPTGDNYGRARVEPVTPELLAEIKRVEEIAAFKKAVMDLYGRINSESATPEHTEAIKKIIAEIKEGRSK